MKNKKIKCDIYTRVSTTMQVDGYSLDAQKEKLKRYAEFQNMEIVNEYSDEGKSGKSVEGRPEFQRMLDNIENGTDEVQFVLVFKLSRFGRNAADVLNSLQRMQDFGVNLICVEDGIDSSKDSGKLAYGRRKNEKVSGTRNEYRIVKQENYMLHDGIHERIISETDWKLAHKKREKTGVKYEKTHSLDHEHILSGILRCPLCGSGMYGNVNRKKKKDGTLYKDYFYYACKHRRLVDGHKCGYCKQWSEEKINNAVEEVIRKLVKNPKFEEAILNKIGSRIDTEEIEKEIEGVENNIEEVKNRLLNIRQQKISEENVYQFLLYFDKLYDRFTDLEKKEFLNSFVEQVDIYEQEQPDGRFLKHIKFRFPVYFGDRETQELCWDNESTVETVCLLSKKP